MVEENHTHCSQVVITEKNLSKIKLVHPKDYNKRHCFMLGQYTLPRVEDIFANLGSGQKFSKIDLRQAYLQLPLNEESRPLTVINTHKGLYAFACSVAEDN